VILVMAPGWRADVDAVAHEFLEDVLGPQIADRARIYAPKDTGALAASVEHHMEGETLVVSATGGDDGRSYAAYIELGHRVFHTSTKVVGPEWVPAEPFLRPALYGAPWPWAAYDGGAASPGYNLYYGYCAECEEHVGPGHGTVSGSHATGYTIHHPHYGE
jgi:hypothetical protein